MITLEMTAGELLYIHHLLNQQSGTYAELKSVWRLEDKLHIGDDIKDKIDWVEKELNGQKVTSIRDDKFELSFELEDQDAKTLQDLFSSFTRWPKRPEVRTLGQKIEKLEVA